MPNLVSSGDPGITELTGDVTAGPGSGSQVATLNTSAVEALIAAYLLAHPVQSFKIGSIYTNITGVNPATELGYGTWTAFGVGQVPVGLDAGDPDFDTPEETGGAKTVAAAGTNSAPAFTGNSVASSADSAGTPAGTVSQPTFTGNPVAAASVDAEPDLVAPDATASGVSPVTTATGTVSQPTFAGDALGTHAHTTTATGSVAAPVFTGTPTSVVQPYIVVCLWKRTA